jgi:ribosomal protein L16 Arg81 hydroxylase
MASHDDDLAAEAAALEKRLDDLRALYGALQETTQAHIDELTGGDLSAGKSAIKKLDEMQSLLVALMKAEEAFNEKFRPTQEKHRANIAALRDKIGGQLDRIRRARRASEVSEKPDAG